MTSTHVSLWHNRMLANKPTLCAHLTHLQYSFRDIITKFPNHDISHNNMKFHSVATYIVDMLFEVYDNV